MSLQVATLHSVLLAMAICLAPALVLILAALICDLCRHWLERDE